MAAATRTLYRLLVENEEEHGCGDLPEEACREVPDNAAKLVGSLTLTKLGDRVVDPKTVLTWLLAGLGTPLGIVAMLVPVRESGALLPQAALVPVVRRMARRKLAWVAASIAQGVAVAGMALAAATLTGAAAGWTVLAILAAFALARSVASISSKDVLGKTVPKGRRGSVTGIAASLSGIGAMAVGFGIAAVGREGAVGSVLVWLLVGAASAWMAAAVLFSTTEEVPGEHDVSIDPATIVEGAALLAADVEFRRFVIVRSLLLVTALSPPFVVTLAAGRVESSASALGPFVIASGVASFAAAPVWGRLADRSSRRVMAVSAASAAAVVVGFLLLRQTEVAESGWLYVGAFLGLAVAHAGARMGRKTYVVDLASGNQRTEYVAVSNTAIGLVLLVIGALGAVVAQAGAVWTLALLAAMGTVGALAAWSLPEVSVAPE